MADAAKIALARSFLDSWYTSLCARMEETGNNLVLSLLDAYGAAYRDHGQEGREALTHAIKFHEIDVTPEMNALGSIAALRGKPPTETLDAETKESIDRSGEDGRKERMSIGAKMAHEFQLWIRRDLSTSSPGPNTIYACIECAADLSRKFGQAGRNRLLEAALHFGFDGEHFSGPAIVAREIQSSVERHRIIRDAEKFEAVYLKALREHIGPDATAHRDLASATIFATMAAVDAEGRFAYQAYRTAVEQLSYHPTSAVSLIEAEARGDEHEAEADEGAGAEP